jgi:hypothetical protein
LPINRKELYYTGTVLPGIVCHDDFRYFHRFLKLLRIEGLAIDADPSSANIQFFTEYGLAESIFGSDTRARFLEAPSERDTPDILIFVDGHSPVLVAIEAKMFDRVSPGELLGQMARQRSILDYLIRCWNEVRVGQAALLPEKLRVEMGPFS